MGTCKVLLQNVLTFVRKKYSLGCNISRLLYILKQTHNTALWTMCYISFVFQTIHTKLGICNKMTSAVLVNSTEGTMVANSISWNVRKVSIVCDQSVHLWQLNNEYTTLTVWYVLTSFRHLFTILIRIF